jgi:hypothetical protein
MPRLARRRGAALGALLLLGGCAPDYSAVRDWSLQARSTVLPPAGQRPGDAPALAPAPPAPVTATGREGAVRALEEAAAAWLAFLGYIAEDGWPRSRTSPLAALVDPIRPFDAEGAEAVAKLGEEMARGARRNWRAPELGEAADRVDPTFQKVLQALSRQLALLQGADPAAIRVRQDMIGRIAAGHAMLKARSTRLSAAETARLLRLQESELRRLAVLGAG